MINPKQTRTRLLVIIGILLIAGVKLLSHHVPMHDVVEGVLMGSGFGLMIMGLFGKRSKRTVLD